MAKYDVTYCCGHEGTVQLYGPHKERERRIEWMERSTMCPECYQEHLAQLRRQENERSASMGDKLGFIALEGSPKQIAWATTIRQKAYESLCGSLRDADAVARQSGHLVEMLNLETQARFWIDHRLDSSSGLLKTLVACHPVAMADIKARIKAADEAAKMPKAE